MLSRLVLRDYRNFTYIDVAVPRSGLAIVGENGHGKSNLLEAVSYLSMLRSSRDAKDVDCVRFGAPAFNIRAECSSDSRYSTLSVGFERATKKKRASLDGVEQPRLSNALGALPSVGFSPSDVMLVTGGPAERRRYLDIILSLTVSAYLPALQQYRAALLRRNAELRIAQRNNVGHTQSLERIAVWEPALAKNGAVITALRAAFVASHEQRFAQTSYAIGETLPLSLRFSSAAGSLPTSPEGTTNDYEVLLADAFETQRLQEMRRGMTLTGPHRDDLVMLLDGRELRTFGSAGQQRSAAIALRLVELAALKEANGRTPLLLLDDPFAELDLRRASHVLELLGDLDACQVLLAVPRVGDVPKEFTRLSRCTMERGTLSCGEQ